MSLDLDELAREPEPQPAKPKRATTRRSSAGDTRGRHDKPTLERRITESLEAVAAWVRDRGDTELGDVLERDASKMAAVLGKLAKLNPLAKTAVSVLADVLEPVRAFGPTLRVVWQRIVYRRQTREGDLDELGDEQVTPPAFVPFAGVEPDEPAIAEPWRLAE